MKKNAEDIDDFIQEISNNKYYIRELQTVNYGLKKPSSKHITKL